MKIALVDDEKKCLEEMEQICGSFGKTAGYPVETTAFGSGNTFLDAFKAGGFDLVFMDVYMEDIDGVTAASEMRKQDTGCLLVFLTSGTEFMPDAFSCHAFEYVTKPFSKERIFGVLSDAVKVLPQEQKYIEFAAGRKSVHVFPAEIVSAVTDAHYLDITFADGEKLRCRMTMPEFLDKTDDARFIPVNKGIAVNAEYILEFERGCCIMENGVKFPVRVRDSAKIEQMAKDYHFKKIRQRQSHSAGRLAPGDFSGRHYGKEK